MRAETKGVTSLNGTRGPCRGYHHSATLSFFLFPFSHSFFFFSFFLSFSPPLPNKPRPKLHRTFYTNATRGGRKNQYHCNYLSAASSFCFLFLSSYSLLLLSLCRRLRCHCQLLPLSAFAIVIFVVAVVLVLVDFIDDVNALSPRYLFF